MKKERGVENTVKTAVKIKPAVSRMASTHSMISQSMRRGAQGMRSDAQDAIVRDDALGHS